MAQLDDGRSGGGPSGSSSDDGGLSGWADLSLPDWLTSLKGLTGVSVLGYDLVSSPESFIVAVVLDTIVGWIRGFAGQVGLLVFDLLVLFTDIVTDTGVALLKPFGAIGDLVLDMVGLVESLIIDIALLSGPFAPLLAVGLWVALFVGLAYALPRAIRLGFRVLTWVIPWL